MRRTNFLTAKITKITKSAEMLPIRVIPGRGELARRMRDAQLHSSQKVLPSSSDLLDLQFSVAISEEFVGWILGLGPEALVLSPQTLATRIQTQAAAVAASYGAEGTEKGEN